MDPIGQPGAELLMEDRDLDASSASFVFYREEYTVRVIASKQD